MRDRITYLHKRLKKVCENVYFQPPMDFELKYPCIVYRKTTINTEIRADNIIYKPHQVYEITVIEKDCDSLLPELVLMELQTCTVENSFVSDTLYHTVFRMNI